MKCAGASSAAAPALLVLADDLTGANDTGVQFAKRGIPVMVLVDHTTTAFPSRSEVVVVNTESRHVPPAEAASRVRRWARLGRQLGVRHFYKKTDSTLRGNIGAELEALREELGLPRIHFVAAFPELGRTTSLGVHHVHGQPIAQTSFADDPLNPVRSSDVREVLRTQGGRDVHSLPWASDFSELSGICVHDCECTEDLHAIASTLARREGLYAAAGSAAFADAVAGLLTLSPGSQPTCSAHAPVLLVNGSLNPRALDQIARVPRSFTRLQLSPEMLLAAKSPNLLDHSSANLLLHSVTDRSGLDPFYQLGREVGLNPAGVAHRAAFRTGEIVRDLLRRRTFGTLIVFGGDTLTGIARACGWTAFLPRAEAGPGVTISQPLDGNLVVMSKAGGFGGEDAVAEILRFIENS